MTPCALGVLGPTDMLGWYRHQALVWLQLQLLLLARESRVCKREVAAMNTYRNDTLRERGPVACGEAGLEIYVH